MRSLHLAILLCVLLLAGTLAADDSSNFRVPPHRVYSLSGNAQGSWHRSSGSSLGESALDRSFSWSTGWTADGTVATNGYWLYDSDLLRLRMNGTATADGHLGKSAGSQDRQPTSFLSHTHGKEQHLEEDWEVDTGLRSYLPFFPVGLTADVNAQGGYEQSWSSSWDETTAGTSYQLVTRNDGQASYQYHVTASVGPGVGRVRDVTSVYDVYLFEQRLREQGVLARELSAAARQRLINLLYFEGEFAVVHDLPEKFFWQNVEDILVADSALGAQGLDAFTLYRLAEPNRPTASSSSSGYPGPLERHFRSSHSMLRQRGWFAGLLLYYTHTHSIGRHSTGSLYLEGDSGVVVQDRLTSSDSHSESWSDMPTYGPQIEGHLPWGPRWQFDGVSTFQTTWTRVSGHWSWNSTFSAAYIIADRWLALANVYQARSHEHTWMNNASSVQQTWLISVGPELHYFIEDHITAYAQLSYYQDRSWANQNAYQESALSNNWGAGWQFNIGVTYRALGRLWAPGTVPETHLLPWPHS